MSKDLRYEKCNIELRRNKVLELIAQGVPQNLVAQQLNVSTATVSLDIQYLKCKSQENLKTHIQDSIPLTYEKAMSALTQVISKVWNIAENSTKTSEKLQAYSQFVDCYKYIMDMSTSSSRITNALKFVLELEDKKILQEQQEQEQESQIQPTPVSEEDPIQQEPSEE
jgi:predicted transcriptional regulator